MPIQQLDKYDDFFATMPQDYELLLDCIPSLNEMERSLRLTKDSAAGVDGFPGLLCKRFAGSLAKLYMPLVVKYAVTGIEPVQWRGGYYRHHHKKHEIANCANHRCFAVTATMGKRVRHCMRERLAPAMPALVGPRQFGGIKSRGTQLAIILLRLLQATAKQQGLTFGAFFLDARNAFYSLVRELVLETNMARGSVGDIADSTGVPAAALHPLKQKLQGPGILARQAVTGHLRALIAEQYRASWLVCESSDHVGLGTKSSIPGQPLADQVYEAAMGEIMQVVEDRLSQHGLGVCIPGAAERSIASQFDDDDWITIPAHSIAFADDGTYFYMGSAEDAAPALELIGGVVLDVFAEYGLQLNLDAGKSEALLAFTGRGSKEAKRQLWHDQQGQLHLVSSYFERPAVSVVTTHVQLGTVVDDHGAMYPELYRRGQTTAQQLQRFRRKVCAGEELPLKVRMIFADSLIMGSRCYSAGSWDPLSAAEANYAHGMVMSVYRAATRSSPVRRKLDEDAELEKTPDAEDDHVLAKAGRARPADLFRVARLRLFGELLQSGPAAVFALMAKLLLVPAPMQRTNWPKLIITDLVWTQQYTNFFKDLPDPGDDLRPWEQRIRTSHTSWKYQLGEVLKAAADDLGRRTMAAAAAKRFFAEAQAAGVPWSSRPGSPHGPSAPAQTRSEAGKWPCPWCDRSFTRQRGLQVHISREHWTMTGLAKQWMRGARQCQACLMQFQRPHHLLEHLAVASPTCLLLTIEGSMPRGADGAVDPPQPKGGFRKRVDIPAVRAAGPTTEEVDKWGPILYDRQSRQVFLECDYALDDSARDTLQAPTKHAAHESEQDVPDPLERYSLDQFKTNEYRGITVEAVPWRIKRAEIWSAKAGGHPGLPREHHGVRGGQCHGRDHDLEHRCGDRRGQV